MNHQSESHSKRGILSTRELEKVGGKDGTNLLTALAESGKSVCKLTIEALEKGLGIIRKG